MLAALSIYTSRPINSKWKFNSFIKPNIFIISGWDFPLKLFSAKIVSLDCSQRFSKKINMASLVRTRRSDEKIEAVEQEAFIDESTRFKTRVLEATLNSLSKWAIAVVFLAIILWRHDAEASWAAIGCILNAGLSSVLKTIINQERPVSTLRSDPGMPSSHAQSIFFIVTFIILSMVEWYQLNGATTIFSAIILGIGGYFSWLRISQKLHTVSQVVVGALLGSIFSFLWYWSWNMIVLTAYEASLTVRMAVTLGSTAYCLTVLVHFIVSVVGHE